MSLPLKNNEEENLLENINKYRGPDSQIQDLYLDAKRTKKAAKDSWLFFNTIFYTLSVLVSSVESGL